jgi:hypothetical protein
MVNYKQKPAKKVKVDLLKDTDIDGNYIAP